MKAYKTRQLKDTKHNDAKFLKNHNVLNNISQNTYTWSFGQTH